MKFNLSPTSVVEEMAKTLNKKSDINCQFYATSEHVPDPRDLSRDKKNLMIFDDLQLEKQNKCESYYIRGRHSNVDCFYLAQNYLVTFYENCTNNMLQPIILRGGTHPPGYPR